MNVLKGRFSSASRLIIKALFADVLVFNYNKNRLSLEYRDQADSYMTTKMWTPGHHTEIHLLNI